MGLVKVFLLVPLVCLVAACSTDANTALDMSINPDMDAPVICGMPDEACCDGNLCATETLCIGGFCKSCGGSGQPC